MFDQFTLPYYNHFKFKAYFAVGLLF